MKILILNWRDIKNPASGGAEILTHEIAKYLIKKKNDVTIFTSRFSGSSEEEKIDGVRVIRKGESIARHVFSSVHFLAFRQYEKKYKNNVDIVIDEVHGLPFFTPWYVKEKRVALVCEVAGDLWLKMFGPFFGSLGRFVEIVYLRFIYRNTFFITISNSAKIDLIKNGVDGKRIAVIPVGVNIPIGISNVKKEKTPTLVFLGRVTKSKGIEDAIRAVSIVSRSHRVNIWIIGKEDYQYLHELLSLTKTLKLEKQVKVCGYVSEREKFELLSRAWILIHPSKTEGWGINVIEGNAMGIPAIGYKVPGLADSIQAGKTGLLTSTMTPEGLAMEIKKLLKNKQLYNKMSLSAVEWAKNFSWEKTGEKTLEILQNL